jgi:hypothetical protein
MPYLMQLMMQFSNVIDVYYYGAEGDDPLVADLAGTYTFDLNPIGYDVIITAELAADGSVYAESDVAPWGELYVEGNVVWDTSAYLLTIPGFNLTQRFTVADGVFTPNKEDADRNVTMILNAADELLNPAPVAEAETEPEAAPDTVDMVAAIAGSYAFDVSSLGYDAIINADLAADGSFYASADVPGFGGLYVTGIVTEADGVYDAVAPDFSAGLSFTIENGVFTPNQADLNKLVGLARMMAYTALNAGAKSAEPVSEEPAAASDASYTLIVEGDYPIAYSVPVQIDIKADGTVRAEASLEPYGGYYVTGAIGTDAGGNSVINIPEYNVQLRYTEADGQLTFNKEDATRTITYVIDLILNLAAAQTAAGPLPGEEAVQLVNMVAAIAGTYTFDMNPVGYDAQVYAEIDEAGTFYAETSIAPWGGLYVEGLLTEADGVYTATVPEFNASLSFTYDGAFVPDQTDMNKIEGLLKMMAYTAAQAAEIPETEVGIVEITETYEEQPTTEQTSIRFSLTDILASLPAAAEMDLSSEGIPLVLGYAVENRDLLMSAKIPGFIDIIQMLDMAMVMFGDQISTSLAEMGLEGLFFVQNGVPYLGDFENLEQKLQELANNFITAYTALPPMAMVDLSQIEGINIPASVRLEFFPIGYFRASYDLDDANYIYADGVYLPSLEGYILILPEHELMIPFTLNDAGVPVFESSDLLAIADIPGVAEFAANVIANAAAEELPPTETVEVIAPAEKDPLEDVYGWYFVDMAPSGYAMNIFFLIDEDGTLYITTLPDMNAGQLYATGTVTYNAESDTYFMEVPEWGVGVEFISFGGDIMMMAQSFYDLIGFAYEGEYGIIERVGYYMQNVPFYEPELAALVPSRDGVYNFDLTPAGIAEPVYLEIFGDLATVFLADGTLLAEGNVIAQDGMLWLSIPAYGVMVDFVENGGVISIIADSINGLAGYNYEGDLIEGYKEY